MHEEMTCNPKWKRGVLCLERMPHPNRFRVDGSIDTNSIRMAQSNYIKLVS